MEQLSPIAFDGEQWRHEVIYVGNDRMRVATIADVMPGREGLEVVISGPDGNVFVLWESRLGSKHEIIDPNPAGQSRGACVPAGVLTGSDNGKVTLAQRTGGRWTAKRPPHHLVAGDIHAAHPGAELVTCGYSGRLTTLLPSVSR